MSETIEGLKEREKAHQGESTHMSRSWLPGAILIILGVIFLVDDYYSFPVLDNWWALFILIPAASNLNCAWRRYQATGRWTSSARGSLVGGLIISLIAFIFLFNLSWALFLPVILIILGVGLLLRAG